MENIVQNSHVSLFKEIWNNRSNAKAFLGNYLPEKETDLQYPESLIK